MNETECLEVYKSSNNKQTDYLMTTFFISIILCSFIANTLMMVGLWKIIRRFSRPQKLYFCLCISDILISVMNVTLNITSLAKSNISCMNQAAQSFLGYFPINVGILIMLSIVIDRYLLITKTRFYNNHIANQRIVITIGANTVIALVISIPNMLISLSNHVQHGMFHMLSAVFMLLILIVMSTLNYLLIWHVKKAATQIQRYTGAQGKHTTAATKLVIILSVIMTICYLPAIIGHLVLGIYTYRGESNTVLSYYSAWTSILFLLNSTINSIIYVRSTDIKYYYRNLIKQFKQSNKKRRKAHIYTIPSITTSV